MIEYIVILPQVMDDLPNELVSSEKSPIHLIQEMFNPRNEGIIYKIRKDQKVELYSEKYRIVCTNASEAGSLKGIRMESINQLQYTIALDVGEIIPGNCKFITSNEARYLNKNESDSSEALNVNFNKKFFDRQAFVAYKDYWETIDAASKFKKEILDDQFKESVVKFRNLNIDTNNNRITLKVDINDYIYKIGSEVTITPKDEWEKKYNSETLYTGNMASNILGQIVESDLKNGILKINSDADIISDITRDARYKKGGVLWIDDIGSRAKMRNEQIALKTLFKEEAANKKLKTFLPDVVNASPSTFDADSLDSEFFTDNFENLNVNQQKAVIGALNSDDLFLIQGPPGTGKTTVITEIIQYLINRGEKVLVSAQTHLAVDNVLQRLGSNEKVNAIRIGNESKFELGNERYALENRVSSLQENILIDIDEREQRYSKIVSSLDETANLLKAHEYVSGKIKVILNLLKNFRIHTETLASLTKKQRELASEIKSLHYEAEKLQSELTDPLMLKKLSDALANTAISTDECRILFELAPIFEYDENIMEDVQKFTGIVDELRNMKSNNLTSRLDELQNEMQEIAKKIEITDNFIHNLERNERETGVDERENIFEYTQLRQSFRLELQDKKNEQASIKNKHFEQLSYQESLKLEAMRIKENILDFIQLKTIDFFEILHHEIGFKEYLDYFDALQKNQKLISSFTIEDLSLLSEMEVYENYQTKETLLAEYQRDSQLLADEIKKEKLFVDKFQDKITDYANIPEIITYLDYYHMKFTEVSDADYSRIEHFISNKNEDRSFVELYEKAESIKDEWKQVLTVYQESFEKAYIDVANLVSATCLGIATMKKNYFQDTEFDYLVVDEAGRGSSLELLIPMVRGKKIILVGDHKQISPELEKEIQKKMEADESFTDENVKMLRKSIFGIMYEAADPSNKMFLNTQFRMSPDISKIVSDFYYDGKLLDAANVAEKTHGFENDLESSFYWISTPTRVDKYKEKKSGTSAYNIGEIETTIDLLSWLEKNATERKTVGIISPYKAHTIKLDEKINPDLYPNLDIEINTVDAFQGREKQIVIINFVRNNNQKEVGFIANDSRMNVAISRAQELLFIVGNSDFVDDNKNRLPKVQNIKGEVQSRGRYLRAEEFMEEPNK